MKPAGMEPCPHCGSGDAGIVEALGVYWGKCNLCLASGPQSGDWKGALMKWNRRPALDILGAVILELIKKEAWNGSSRFTPVWTTEENAPGHCHGKVGIWDSDNGEKAGTACSWCLAWNRARRALAARKGALL